MNNTSNFSSISNFLNPRKLITTSLSKNKPRSANKYDSTPPKVSAPSVSPFPADDSSLDVGNLTSRTSASKSLQLQNSHLINRLRSKSRLTDPLPDTYFSGPNNPVAVIQQCTAHISTLSKLVSWELDELKQAIDAFMDRATQKAVQEYNTINNLVKEFVDNMFLFRKQKMLKSFQLECVQRNREMQTALETLIKAKETLFEMEQALKNYKINMDWEVVVREVKDQNFNRYLEDVLDVSKKVREGTGQEVELMLSTALMERIGECIQKMIAIKPKSNNILVEA